MGSAPAVDSMYNPLQEEYLIVEPDHILPEFVVQYKFLRRNRPGQSTLSKKVQRQADKTAPNAEEALTDSIIPINLSQSKPPFSKLPWNGDGLVQSGQVLSSYTCIEISRPLFS